jgi:hypothetical protein
VHRGAIAHPEHSVRLLLGRCAGCGRWLRAIGRLAKLATAGLNADFCPAQSANWLLIGCDFFIV